jgi:uncharacterized protein YcbX
MAGPSASARLAAQVGPGKGPHSLLAAWYELDIAPVFVENGGGDGPAILPIPFEYCSMGMELGHVSALFRYPIKSIAGERLEAAKLGWHGVEGDRRLAFRRLADRGAFPWLTASRFPELLLYKPVGRQDTTGEPLPTHVRTPGGREYALTDEALRKEIATRHRAEVELMQLRHGIFDEAGVSVITLGTIQSIARAAGRDADVRRFRPNLVLDTRGAQPFEEDRWVGKILEFGSPGTGPAVSVTMRDERCVMVNLDPDTAEADAEVMKAVICMNENYAGVYGTVVRTGELRVGQVVSLRA